MNGIRHIFFALIWLMLTAACHPSRTDRERLERAEAIVRQYPDSAITILDSITPSALSHADFRARATLATAEAAYQQSGRVPSDSLLDESVHYYLAHNDGPRKLRALYLRGYQNYLAQHYGNAIVDYLSAEQTAKTLSDSISLGLIYRALGNVYYQIKDYSSALENQKLSAEIFKALKPKEYYPFSQLELGNAYYNSFNYEECISTIRPLLSLKHNFDSIEQVAIFDLLASSYINTNKYEEAKPYIDTVRLFYPNYQNEKFLQSAGQLSYYLNLGADFDYYLTHLRQANPNNKWLDYLNALKQNENEKALKYLQKEFQEIDSFFMRTLGNDVRTTALKYYNTQNKHLIDTNRRNSFILSASIVCCLLVILCLMIYLFYRRRVQSILNANHNEFVHQLFDTINQYKTDLGKLSQTNAELEEQISTQAQRQAIKQPESTPALAVLRLPSKFDALAQLCDTYYCYKNSPKVQSKIFNELITIISNLEFNSSQFVELIDFINQHHNNIYTQFKTDYPKLSDNELQLFALLVLGFSPKIIAVVQGLTTDQFYARKTYLKKKITKSDPQRADDYLRFF